VIFGFLPFDLFVLVVHLLTCVFWLFFSFLHLLLMFVFVLQCSEHAQGNWTSYQGSL
jgi:hypothetical protein